MQSIFDQFDTPPIANLLGWTLANLDIEKGTIEITFNGRSEFANPGGTIQGGIISAMLDDTMGPAIVAHTDGKFIGQTIDLHTHFLKPVPIGPISTFGKILRLGSRIAFAESRLFDKDSNLAATATAALMLRPLKPGRVLS